MLIRLDIEIFPHQDLYLWAKLENPSDSHGIVDKVDDWD